MRIFDSSNERRREYEYIGFTEQPDFCVRIFVRLWFRKYNRKCVSGSISGRQSSSAEGGTFHGTLKMGYLHSEFSPVTGQELHMKYDDSSTEEDPVMLVEGKDIQGNDFVKKIHLNDVDPGNATPAEMTALRVHLAQQGDRSVKTSSGIPLKALSSRYNVNSSMNFRQYYEGWASNLEHAGFHQNADLYRSELERYLFYHRVHWKDS